VFASDGEPRVIRELPTASNSRTLCRTRVIRFDGVTKHYGKARVLGPISLDVSEHVTLALVGTSGSGKSTLLRMVVGLVTPDEGRVSVAGQAVTPETVQGLRRRIGYVIQHGGLLPHLTAKGNATLMARHLGWAKARIEARFEELSALVQLRPEVLGRYGSQLSGGEQQRVSLVRALFLDPDVLLLDEPLGALDVLVRSELQAELRAIFRTLQKTVLFVTHDLAEAAFIADDIAVMHDGHVVQRGSMDALAKHPADEFVARFVGAQRPLLVEGGAGP
jgi:osmoprotectant transport system ATP-binding protein